MLFFKKYYQDLALALGWMGVLLTVFIQNRTLSSDLEVGRRIWLYTSAPIFILISTLILWRKGKKYIFSGWDFCYVITFVYLTAIFYAAPLPAPHKWAQTILLLCIAYILRVWLYENRIGKRIVSLSLCLIGAIESVWAVLQLTGIIRVNHFLYPLTGSFQNPGPFSGFIALLLPFALNQALQSYGYIRKINILSILSTIPMIACLMMVVVLPAGFSRIAWLAGLAGCCSVLFFRYDVSLKIRLMFARQPKILWSATVIMVILITVGSFFAYQFKKDSADGRALIWKVSLSAVQKEPMLWGKGLGTFAQEYGQAQHDYMKTGNPTEQEKNVAGAPEYAFNEFLGIGVEMGVFGLCLFIIIILLLLKRASLHINSSGVFGCIISFTIFAFASYPMSQLPFWIVLITLPALVYETRSRRQAKSKIVLPIVLSTLFLISLATVWSRRAEKENYQNAENQPETSLLEKKTDLLYYDPPILFDYGKRLIDRAETTTVDKKVLLETALFYFEQGAARSCDPMFQVMQGRCYEVLNDFEKASVYYEKAHYMIPNRLYPLFRLAMLYNNPQSPFASNEKAKYYALKLLETPVKITSPATDEMRAMVKKLLKN